MVLFSFWHTEVKLVLSSVMQGQSKGKAKTEYDPGDDDATVAIIAIAVRFYIDGLVIDRRDINGRPKSVRGHIWTKMLVVPVVAFIGIILRQMRQLIFP